MGQWLMPSVIIAAISLLVSFAALVRTWRHEPEASWMHTSIVSDLPGIVPSLSDERGRMPVRMGMLSNDGDGDAFDVRVFGHDCIVRAYAWEKLKDGRWKIGERTMIPRVETANDDVKIAIWPPEGTDELPSDAAICIHWTKNTYTTETLWIPDNPDCRDEGRMVGRQGLESLPPNRRENPRTACTSQVPPQS